MEPPVTGADGRLHINSSNPLDELLGLDPKDPHGQDDVIIQGDQLHLQLGKPVKILLRSLDVVHDFYVPEFRAKMDMIPGSVTYYWCTPTRVGTFEALCAELCGTGHSHMRGSVVVELESDHQTWLLLQKTFAQLRAPVRADAGNERWIRDEPQNRNLHLTGNRRRSHDR